MNRRNFIGTTSLAVAGITALKTQAFAAAVKEMGIAEYYKDDFYIGTAISGRLLNNGGELLELVKREFNSITAENEFKWSSIQPDDDTWRFDIPDKFVEFGLENNMYMLGHCLVWHSQVPRSIFRDADGNEISKEGLLKRMENHIGTLVGRYKGKVQAWDVVNEAIEEKAWRNSPWTRIIGKEFVERAFHLAHEADPDAHLIYNDYNMDQKGKRDQVVEMIRDFKKRGVPIHGIGLQGHIALDNPEMSEFEASVKAYADEGMKVHVTELDISVLPYDWGRTAEISTNREYAESLNPYKDGMPKKVAKQLAKRYVDLFKVLLKYKESVERVTFWGISDDMSWKNNFPMRGRTDYPLLFDREHKPKLCYDALVKLKK
ncbi:MAG: endo-1,4-beta-xylanase [Prolixibacteraceae bacterium]|nr:endo-1,4-beta-xylanase [Prolixibacteraceae bacterium]MBN2774470.1 endo-1,4-beta-xylanase [Prolixibacteraceae bacterium]